jgi:hypothetical protein
VLGQLRSAASSTSETSLTKAVESLSSLLQRWGFQPEMVAGYDETVVVEREPVPIDLIPVAGTPLGLRVVISHVVASDGEELRRLLGGTHSSKDVPLNRAALLAIATLPRSISRQNHDIVKAALTLSDKVPVDILISPETNRSIRYFAGKDIQILSRLPSQD